MKILTCSIILLCIIGVAYTLKISLPAGSESVCIIKNGQTEWYLEIADSAKERTQGLMNRDTICETCGMIFLFPEQKPLNFWMKNTLIPLDIYFYDQTGKLVDLVKNMRPETETSEPMRYSSLPAKYALEVREGSDINNGLIDILPCISKIIPKK